MEFNEYERKLITSLGLAEEDDYAIVCNLSDYLTNAYWELDTEEKVKQLMLAGSYLKRLFQKVCEKRNIPIDESKIDMTALLESCKSEYEALNGLDVSCANDEKALGESINTIVKDYTAEQVMDFATYFEFFYKSFHNYMAEHIVPVINNYNDFYYEVEEPQPSDPFLDAIFGQENDDEFQIIDGDDLDWGEGWDFCEVIEPNDDFGTTTVREKKELTDEQIVELLKFLDSIMEMTKIHSILANNFGQLSVIADQKKIESYMSDPEFVEKFRAIMEHDKKTHNYRFHGTTCLEDAISICEQGLGVMRDNLDSTSYSELTMEQVITHERGFCGEIGREAYIIIDEPKGVEVLEPLQEGEEVNFAGSGLQGFDAQAHYIVRSKYIVGYVDKLNREIVFNPEYYDYERFKEYISKKSV